MDYECSICKEIKEQNQFYKESRRKSGISARCKECYNAGLKKFNNICEQCGQPYTTQERGRKYCSRECYYVVNSSKEITCKISIECPICSKELEVWRSHAKNCERVYCSRTCKDRGASVFYSGKDSPHWNHGLTEDERQSARKYEEYYEWRGSVFSRDSYSCQCCGDASGGNLVAHHILNYSEHTDMRTEITNGLTMCLDCHKGFHDAHGYTNNDAHQLTEYLKTKTPSPKLAFLLTPLISQYRAKPLRN